MTIEAGALSLRITEQGGAQVEQRLTNIDTKATALGSKTVQIRMTAPGIERLDNQLEQLGKQAQLYSQGATFASTRADSLRELGAVEKDLRGIIASGITPLEQRIKAEQTLASLAAKQPTVLGSLQTALGRTFAAYMTFGAVTSLYDALSSASDRAEVAQMKLNASAKLTGTSLSTVTAISEQAQSKFSIGSAAASELAGGFVRLSSRAGDVAKTGGLMTAWMDLAAANGLTLDQGMQALSTTLAGQDEGLNRLGLANPSQIWAKWADAVGAHNGQLNEQQKWLAIVNEVMAQGETVRGSYAQFLDTTPGKQQQLNAELERTAAAFGQSIAPARIWAYEVGTAILTVIRRLHEMKDTPAFQTVMDFFSGNIGRGVARMMAPENDHVVPGSLQFQQTTGLLKPPPKTAPKTMTAAERKAAVEAAEEARIQRLLDRTNVGAPGVTDIIGRNSAAVTIGQTGSLVGVDRNGKMKGEKPFGIADVVDKELDALMEKMKAKKKMVEDIATDVAFAIGDAFSSAFSSAFKGEDNFFAAFGKALLSSLGNILMSIGTSMIAYGAILTPLLGIPGPFQVLGMGAAASAAAGIALVALGAGMGALGAGGNGGKGGGGAGGKGATAPKPEDNTFALQFDPDRKLRGAGRAVVPAARSIDNIPMPEGRPMVVIGAINSLSPDDAKWQRAVAETYQNARERGLIRKTG
jgi:hypothetical protein